MGEPIVTVLSSVYNKGERTKATIDSILGQTLSDLVYLVVDDESTDNTEEICRSYDDSRLIYRRQQNKGFVKTMIDLVNDSETEFIAIQGAGDTSSPDRLRVQVEYLRSNPDCVAVGCAYDEHCVEAGWTRTNAMPVFEANSPTDILQQNMFSQGEVMFRRSSYYQAGGYRAFFKYCQDFDLWLRMLKIGKMCRLSQTLYTRQVSANGDITGNPDKSLEQYKYMQFARYLAEQDLKGGLDNLTVDPESHREAFDQGVHGNAECVQWICRQVRFFIGGAEQELSRVKKTRQIVNELMPGGFDSKELALRVMILRVVPSWYEKYYRLYPRVSRKITRIKRRLLPVFVQ